jgi:hypothetical protein
MEGPEGPSLATAFEHHVLSGAPAADVADAVAAAWHQVQESLTPIIGPQGVAALYKRSLLLTSRSHAWLAVLQSHPDAIDVGTLKAVLTRQETKDAALAAGQLLQTFYELLSQLIGPSLAHRLMGFMWQPLRSRYPDGQ